MATSTAPHSPSRGATQARLLVVTIGASLPAIAACVAWWLGLPLAAGIFAGGAVAGPVAAWRRSRALVAPGWVSPAVGAGIEAVALAAAAVTAVLAASTLATPSDVPGGGPVAALWLGVYVVPYAAFLGLPAALPVAVVAGWLVRRTVAMDPDRARRHLALLAVVTGLLVGVTLLGVTGVLGPVAVGPGPIE